MKNHLRIVFKTLIVLLLIGIPTVFYGQNASKNTNQKSNKFESYWYININAGINQMYGDIQDNNNPGSKLSDETKFAGGIKFGRELNPILGIRAQTLYGQLKGARKSLNQSFLTNIFAYNIGPTINLNNLIGKYNPDRLINAYTFTGIGLSNFYVDLTTNNIKSTIWKEGKGLNSWTSEATIPAGLGANVKLNKKWDLNFEASVNFLPTKDGGDKLDGVITGDHNDAYDYYSIGLTYKFQTGAGIKKMSKESGKVQYKTTPNVLEAKGDSIKVEIKGTIPEKYFGKKTAMNFTPVLKYNGDSSILKSITLQGESVVGNGIVINYKNGGTFTYKDVIPYKPEMNKSELVANPIIYSVKGTLDTKESIKEIKDSKKFVEVGKIKLADGVIYTTKSVKHDEDVALANDKYEKVTIDSKDATIYFAVNLYNINMRLPLNVNRGVKNNLQELKDFINKGWKIRDIDINAWASPEGEETFNEGLSERRANTGSKYSYSLFKKLARQKNSIVKIKHPEKQIKFNIFARGEDWDGFMKSVETSNITDKNIILNVINSQPDLRKREQEIRNMTIVYKEIEDDILPPLRRVNIKVNCFEPKKSDEKIAELSTSYPDSLNIEELLYAATLTNDLKIQLKIYKSASILYPQCWRAFNNAATTDIKLGNFNEASVYLKKANALSPNNGKVLNNLGVIASVNKEYKKAKSYFMEAQKIGINENYNLGIIMITEGDYNKALNLFRGKKCNYNVALANLLSGNSSIAENNLKCAPKDAESYYLMAVVGARTNNTSLLYDNLIKAVKANPSLKEKAKEDREFINYFNNPDFKNVVK